MKKLFNLLLFSSIICCQSAEAQSTGINNVSPNKYAALDIQSAGTLSQGILIPRLKSNAKSSFGYGASEQGMIIYGADTDSLYYWTGYSWRTLQPASAPPSGPWTKTGSVVQVTSLTDNVGIGVTPAGTKLEIRGVDASPTYLALRITNSLANTLMTVSNAGDVTFPKLVGKGVVLADALGALSVKKGNPVTGVGTPGKVAFWNNADSLSYNTNFHWDNTNARLGIGTALPTASLSVGEKFLVNASNGAASFSDPTGSITFPEVAAATNPMIYMFASGTTNTDRMVIGHSAAYPNWGLQYNDNSDVFGFLSSGVEVLNVNLGSQTVSIPPLAGPGSVVTDVNGNLGLNKSAFRAYIPTTQNMNGSTQVANFTSEAFDINGDYDPASKQFTAPTSGVYNFSWCIYFYSVTPVNSYCYARLLVNGGVIDYGLVVSGGFYDPVRGNRTIKLNAGDKVSVDVNAPSGSVSPFNYYSDFSGFRVF